MIPKVTTKWAYSRPNGKACLSIFLSLSKTTNRSLLFLSRSSRLFVRVERKTAMGTGREASVSLDGVRDKNVMQLKKLNTVLFPVRYNDKYYADAIASGEFTKLGSSSLLGECDFDSDRIALIGKS